VLVSVRGTCFPSCLGEESGSLTHVEHLAYTGDVRHRVPSYAVECLANDAEMFRMRRRNIWRDEVLGVRRRRRKPNTRVYARLLVRQISQRRSPGFLAVFSRHAQNFDGMRTQPSGGLSHIQMQEMWVGVWRHAVGSLEQGQGSGWLVRRELLPAVRGAFTSS